MFIYVQCSSCQFVFTVSCFIINSSICYGIVRIHLHALCAHFDMKICTSLHHTMLKIICDCQNDFVIWTYKFALPFFITILGKL